MDLEDEPPSILRGAIDSKLQIPFSAVNGVKYYMGLVGENPTRVGFSPTVKTVDERRRKWQALRAYWAVRPW